MSNDAFMILLAVGVPAIAIAGLCLAICVTSGGCSRREEAAIDAAALEGDLTHYIRSLNKGEVA